MLRMETVAERMADYFVSHHPTMPGSGKTAQAVDAARCLEDSAHASMMTSVPRPRKTTAAASSIGLRSCYTQSGQNVARVNRVQFGDDLCMIGKGCAVLRELSLEEPGSCGTLARHGFGSRCRASDIFRKVGRVATNLKRRLGQITTYPGGSRIGSDRRVPRRSP